MAYVICVILTKGGIGKTTVAVALGEAASLGGGPVADIDGDPMGGLSRWAQLAEASGRPLRASVHGMPVQDLQRRIHPIARDNAVIVIDSPPPGPGAASIAEAAIEAADLVVMPVPPRPGDMDRVQVTRELADKHGKPARAVMTMVRGGVGPERRRLQALELLDGMEVTRYRTEFRYSSAVEDAYGTYPMPASSVMRFGMDLLTEILTTEIQKGNSNG